MLHTRRGTDLAPPFPDIVAATAQLPNATALDGELVVWDGDRLAFERLQAHPQRHSAGAARLAQKRPAHYVAFDLLRLAGDDTTAWPYRERRTALERLFAERAPTGRGGGGPTPMSSGTGRKP